MHEVIRIPAELGVIYIYILEGEREQLNILYNCEEIEPGRKQNGGLISVCPDIMLYDII